MKSVEILTEYEDGRPADARFVVDAGAIKDTYELEYDWNGDDARSRGSSRRARCSRRSTAPTS